MVFGRFSSYLRAQTLNNPVVVWSIALGCSSPLMVIVVPKIRRDYLGIARVPEIPTSYPIPNRARQIPLGFDDE
ncbi:hypothetical protein K493DRAFT_310680 [Basidiobolus meristosporus CBS 931.73]|uniref:NADH-ubiquinone oxidoreductase 9.5 kDa subunit n=1 Tax=Basidiobolus meristosporus CBS 931.73 TaxID=1314790 RepID=A0A1Y1Z7A3_9FUNG|nr:hypothetical protein K493DRAFT_310680 [Basidiobolus meristosporus CBS 931.73]|eukprot:ORY06178.1 hypothetical protein K493DRAFT_310680 [Basidiobolus meristosporus CBS 931.73]